MKMTNNNEIRCKICKRRYKPLTESEKRDNICYVCQFKSDISIDDCLNDIKAIKIQEGLKGGKKIK